LKAPSGSKVEPQGAGQPPRNQRSLPLIIMIAGLVLTLTGAGIYLVFKKGGLVRSATGVPGTVKVTRSVSGGVPALSMSYLSGYNLEGIVVGGKDAHVVINGKELRQGDYIDSLQVRNITSSSVELYDSKRDASSTLAFSF